MSPRSDFCLASSPAHAERIVHNLREADFSPAEISLLLLAPTTGSDGAISEIEGLGPLAIASEKPLLAAGPIARTMNKSGVLSVTGGLLAFGIPDAEADRYETLIQDGHVLIAVHTTNSDRGNQAREIYQAATAVDIFTIMAVTTPRVPMLPFRSPSRAAG